MLDWELSNVICRACSSSDDSQSATIAKIGSKIGSNSRSIWNPERGFCARQASRTARARSITNLANLNVNHDRDDPGELCVLGTKPRGMS
jgi:hypothetical protein